MSNPIRAVWWKAPLQLLGPPAVLLSIIVFAWRLPNPFTTVVAYGDALEVLWATEWLRDSLAQAGRLTLFVPGVFMPEGWQLATLAHGMGLFGLTVPIAFLTNSAFAYNLILLAGFFLGFFGLYRLARLMTGRFYAVIAAVFYVTWGGRWMRLDGMPGLWLGSALLPWLLLALELSLQAGSRRWFWLLLSGIIWAVTISLSLYFLWIGAVLVAAWLLGAFVSKRINAVGFLQSMLLTGVVALILMTPYLIIFWRASEASHAAPFTIFSMSNDATSLDWLAAPYLGHLLPVVRELAFAWIDGIVLESSLVGFGIVLSLLGVMGVVLSRRRVPQWGSLFLIVGVGLVLALGPVLHWNGQLVRLAGLGWLNQGLWQMGHSLKPTMFPGETAPAAFAESLPLPGMILAILVPFFEGARVTARYAFVAAPGIVLFAALALERLRWPLLKVVVVGIVLLSVLRTPLRGVPFPPPGHPAFDWLATQQLSDGGSILEIVSPENNLFIPMFGGEALWATRLHHQPIAHGGGSVLPGHVAYLRDWMAVNASPLPGDDFAWMLNSYGVELVLVHIRRDSDRQFIDNALAAGFEQVDCFEPSSAGPPWNYPICVLRVPRMSPANFNVRPIDGWSGAEDWGRWAETTEASLQWITTDEDGATLAVEAFPYCDPGTPQSVEFVVKEQVVGEHSWTDCDAWQGQIVVPPDLETIGPNEMVLRFRRADRPIDLTDGANPDIRELSVGFTRFELLHE